MALWIGLCLVSLPMPLAAQQPSVQDFDRGVSWDEVVQLVEEHFYDPDFDVAAWQARAAGMRDTALQAESRAEFAEVVNQLLASLGVSHTGYFSQSDPRRYQLLGVFHQLFPADRSDLFVYEGIGIATERRADQTWVISVYDGLPAAAAGLRFGDQLVAVDGKPFRAVESFRGRAGDSVQLEYLRGGQSHTVSVEVVELDGRTLFAQALQESLRVIQVGDRSIGYLHAWSYAGTEIQDQIREAILWGPLSQCDALVLDLRDGWGGADVNYLNLFRPPIVQVDSSTRKGEARNFSGVWGKPVALLTNRRSTSGKELFTFGFRKLKLGKVFGEQTAGAVLGGRCFLLENGDVLYLAVVDIRVDGQRLEGIGVAPDVEIPRNLENAEAHDPQLDAAVKDLALELEQQAPHR